MKKSVLLNREIPSELLNELKRRNIYDYEVISVNIAKGRYNIRAMTEDQRDICIKYNDAGGRGRDSLEKEKKMYQRLVGTLCVPAVIWNESILATEYINNSCTFREWLCEQDDRDRFSIYLNDTLQKYKVFLNKINDVSGNGFNDSGDNNQLEIFFDKLLFSGPYGTGIYKLEKFRNRIIKYFLTKRKVFNNQAEAKKCLIHGDFHLNNVLVGDDKAYIIDLENVSYGDANIELAYWYVQVWMLIYNNKEMIEILHKEIDKMFDADLFNIDEFKKIVDLYRFAIIMNRRFHRYESKVNSSLLKQSWKKMERHQNILESK